MRGVGVVPPVLAGQGLGDAGLLDRVALQALADEGKPPALAAEAQRHQLLGANPGIGGGQPQLGFVVVAEADAAAVMQQQLQTPQGMAEGLIATPVAPLVAAQR
jgi:hypothetical protein